MAYAIEALIFTARFVFGFALGEMGKKGGLVRTKSI
jgi:hypothetical protein